MTPASYAVLWRESSQAADICAGKLELGSDRLRLEGTARGRPTTNELDYGELAAARLCRSGSERIGGSPTLVLERKSGPPLLVRSLAGFGIVHELVEILASLLGGASPPPRSAAAPAPTSSPMPFPF